MPTPAWRSFVPGGEPLDPAELRGEADDVARSLLGCHLLAGREGEWVGGRIVETEAYTGPDDPASHAAARIGRTARNEPMFGRAGTAYVYFVYGMHWCFNVVTGEVGEPAAVLVRALEPGSGLRLMASRRGRDRDLCNGPARLCQALGVDGSLNGHDLRRPPLVLAGGKLLPDETVGVSGRIGVSAGADRSLRFFIRGHPDVSSGRPADPSSGRGG